MWSEIALTWNTCKLHGRCKTEQSPNKSGKWRGEKKNQKPANTRSLRCPNFCHPVPAVQQRDICDPLSDIPSKPESVMVKIRYLWTHREIVSFCCYFTVENINRELSCTGFFNKNEGLSNKFSWWQTQNIHLEINLHTTHFWTPCHGMLWMLNFYTGLKSGWINKERKFCMGLLNIRISPLVQEFPHL